MTASSASRVQKHRDALRANGLRPVQIWVPASRSPPFPQESQLQMRSLQKDPQAAPATAATETHAPMTPSRA